MAAVRVTLTLPEPIKVALVPETTTAAAGLNVAEELTVKVPETLKLVLAVRVWPVLDKVKLTKLDAAEPAKV